MTQPDKPPALDRFVNWLLAIQMVAWTVLSLMVLGCCGYAAFDFLR